ncbi:type VI secretion system baseplate subunit TssK [Terrarubrum flagellatum]|uniref:type VI secretion system baseplate subunit TssK n=1 Tax=Terrirubrum flagellatum TaxID=2895980 RepID=UPI0031455BE3
MSWYNKVLWKEGLFLRPHHLQQNDRYHEHLLESRVRTISPYPWGFSALEIDRDLLQQRKFALRRAAGVLQDGTPFDLPADSPLPLPIEVPDTAAGQFLWLTMPMATSNSREVDQPETESASRYVAGLEMFIDSTSSLRIEEEIDIASPRLALELRKTAKPGFVSIGIARVLEVRDKAVLLDDQYVPPVLICTAHPVVDGWTDRVLGWIDNKVEELARYAADPTAGGGLQSVDYFVLQLLNHHGPVLKHLRRSRYVHPERLYEEMLRFVGELATFSSPERRANDYEAYDHDDLEGTFAPIIRDIQAYLSVSFGRRALRLEIIERAPNAFVSTIRDRSLFRTANLILEVSARRPLSEIQAQFPHLFKIGPNTKMNEIVHTHLPGVGLVHLPAPPPQIRAMADHVYFLFDRNSPLWPEFSSASAIGMHFAGDWPELELELWAVLGDRR